MLRKLSALAVLALATAARADVLVVSPTGHFPTIQSAVDAAVDDDVILVKSGTYYSFVVRGKSLVIAEDAGQTVRIDGAIRIGNINGTRTVVLMGLENTGGIVTTNVVAQGGAEMARPILVHDGKIVVVGNVEHGTAAETTRDIVVLRFNASNGMPDITFGNNGVAKFVLSDGEQVLGYGLARTANNDYVVSGTRKAAGRVTNEYVVLRVSGTNGALVTTFGSAVSSAQAASRRLKPSAMSASGITSDGAMRSTSGPAIRHQTPWRRPALTTSLALPFQAADIGAPSSSPMPRGDSNRP